MCQVHENQTQSEAFLLTWREPKNLANQTQTRKNCKPSQNPKGFTFKKLPIFFYSFLQLEGYWENLYKIAHIFCVFLEIENFSAYQREYWENFAIFTPNMAFLNLKIKPKTLLKPDICYPNPTQTQKKIKTWP